MRNLEKIIKDALGAKKCKFGAREVMHSTKGFEANCTNKISIRSHEIKNN